MNNKYVIKHIIATILVFLGILFFFIANSFKLYNFIPWALIVTASIICLPIKKILTTKSRIDYMLLIIFFVSLVIPTIKINESSISEKENRFLSNKALFWAGNKINYKFGEQYEHWLNDRFFGREALIKLYKNIIYRISVFVYKAGKFFLIKSNNYIMGPAGDNNVTLQDLYLITKNLKTYQNNLEKQGIQLYILTFPHHDLFEKDNNIIYSKKSNINNITDVDSKSVNPKELEYILRNKYGINYIYANDILEQNRNKDYIYYKTDHHFTDFGYFIVYSYLMEFIQKDFPDIKISTINDFKLSKNKLVRHDNNRKYHYGVEYKVININDEKILDTKYTFFDYKDIDKLDIIITNKMITEHKNTNGKYKVLLIGDSFVDGLVYFLDTSFADIESFITSGQEHKFEMKDYEKTIKDYKPDIIILVRNFGGIRDLKNIYYSKFEKQIENYNK